MTAFSAITTSMQNSGMTASSATTESKQNSCGTTASSATTASKQNIIKYVVVKWQRLSPQLHLSKIVVKWPRLPPQPRLSKIVVKWTLLSPQAHLSSCRMTNYTVTIVVYKRNSRTNRYLLFYNNFTIKRYIDRMSHKKEMIVNLYLHWIRQYLKMIHCESCWIWTRDRWLVWCIALTPPHLLINIIV